MSEEMRRYHRMGVALEMQVSGTDRRGVAFEEKTSSDDVSRGGCSFHTERELPTGTELELIILRRSAARRPPVPFLTTGVVVRSGNVDAKHFKVSVCFTGPQFPTYASESTA
ncbi:MAG: PilZ domain-containing protein [Acidobacteria bacterium]|nr:PilZ domain-containing protein [Acidobacteriota bacterium]